MATVITIITTTGTSFRS
ncbi:hypothetical protein LINPERHAP1_LOCUS27323 [Linum perenne]